MSRPRELFLPAAFMLRRASVIEIYGGVRIASTVASSARMITTGSPLLAFTPAGA